MTVITSHNLTKQYGDKKALDQLTLTINENKIIGIIGRNGAGKTTLLKTCAGYIKPTSGELHVWGQQPFDNLQVLSNVIFIDEEVTYDETLKLKDILALGKIYYARWDEAFAKKLLHYFDLNVKQKYDKLSRGMKTQFNIIMGLSSRSPLTIFDEPTLGLDAAFRKEFYHILLNDYMKHPRTMMISSHMLHEMENLLEEIVLIHDGKLVMHDPIDVFQNYGVMLNGKNDQLLPFVENRQVLHQQPLGLSSIVGIKNDLTEEDLHYLNEHHIDISPMHSEDVCVYLTANGKVGGFDGYQ
ncbi:ABC transporter ATP-binding protein [Vallitalea pronyensis]|uniref:ABC transporter ATP-binding protein n=1 Tax=Vallitalea pronyensis TaxID=1348613 RepID=A0A8J8MLM2_9FIRM|nr:ABC transporter ATP-binding protein [Vallitalea pronyensis]QUI23749.1 ABC transporter ATP-binding protein [Vallitalea pronyensis]